jgi:hypothetical protein
VGILVANGKDAPPRSGYRDGMGILVAVTDHAVERFRQRVGSRSGALDPRPEIAGRVSEAWAAGRWSETAPAGIRSGAAARGSVYVRDLVDRDLLFVCRHDRSGAGELIVISLWEEGRVGTPRVPRRYTDALRPSVRRP